MRRSSLGLWRLALCSMMALGAGCGGSAGTILVSHDVSITIVHGDGATDLPFDPREARIAAATEQLTAIVGHPLGFEIDVALLPDWRAGLEDALITTLENVARDLKQLKEEEPRTFAFGVARVDRIVCRYSSLVEDRELYGRDETKLAVLDESARSVVLTSKANGTLVPRASVARAIDRSFQASLTRRFADQEPEAIAVADRADYFAYAGDGYHRQYDKEPKKSSAPEPLPHAVWIARVARLVTMVGSSNPELAAKIRAWMFGQMDDFMGSYANQAPQVQAQPPGSPWKRAESAYVGWLNGVQPTLTDDEAVLVMQNGIVPGYGGVFHHDAFPGFDPFAFGLREADLWVKAGHPTDRRSVSSKARLELFSNILCLPQLGRVDRCTWLESTAESDRDMQRLADALVTRHDAVLTTTVTRGFPKKTRMDLLHKMERDEPTLTAGLQALMTTESDPSLVPELRRLWRAHPHQRGAILYILTLLDPYGDPGRSSSKVPWADFARTFEGGATRGDIASYFGEGPDVVPGARFLFATRAGRFSFVDLLIPRLDVWLADPAARDREAGGGRDGHLGEVIEQICHDGDEVGMAALRAYFGSRVARHPGDFRNDTMDAWPSGHCHK